MAVETLGPLSVLSFSFLVDVGRKISERTGEPLEVQFLFQQISVSNQRFNSVLFHETFPFFCVKCLPCTLRLSQLRTIPTHNHSSLF